MVEIRAGRLQVGDLYYFRDRYWEVIHVGEYSKQSKCIMSPTDLSTDIGSFGYPSAWFRVMLLCRDGEEV